MWEFFQKNDIPADQMLSRTQQLLGLPQDHKGYFVMEYWIQPGSLFRPAMDPSITAAQDFPNAPTQANTFRTLSIGMRWSSRTAGLHKLRLRRQRRFSTRSRSRCPPRRTRPLPLQKPIQNHEPPKQLRRSRTSKPGLYWMRPAPPQLASSRGVRKSPPRKPCRCPPILPSR